MTFFIQGLTENNSIGDVPFSNFSLEDFENLSRSDKESPVFPTYIRVVFTSFCILVFVVGFSGNMMVPIVLIRNKDMQNSTNLFLLNLSIADLLVLLVCLPSAFVELHSPPDVWLLGEQMCKYINNSVGCILIGYLSSFDRQRATDHEIDFNCRSLENVRCKQTT